MNIITGETTENIETTSLRTQSDVKTKISKKVYIKIKRVIDVILASVALILLSPLFAIIAIAIKIDSKGPVFFAHKRIGKNGKIIKLYKFRSMVINAEELIKSFTPEQMREYKENYKLTNDPRITKVGKFLRKTSLDELPQLINIINGDLSIIGPRPVVADELEKYGVNKDKFLSVTPGLTGYWAANGRSNTTYEQRMEMELYYIDNLSLKMDIKVFFKTILSVLKKEGAR
ncbi:MAG TPA: exopolysaccharide biosynthesis protein [Clostridiales bacterium]|jgi:lipopolysaccharide/colanic/teichoic acid biosynthesis glycosyltransferase|nr:sugar transferase [Clostridium sp.]HCQ56118.1 exopolysaccharide biosynthesis protein [Clostridiales bacterium]